MATSPFTGNNNASTLIDESQEQIDLLIGSENYDIGHTFSTGAGGLASLGSVCNPIRKVQGVTGSSQPRGEYFDVDFVAHEIGHQLGANHTFNGANGGCAGSTRWYLSAYEPGSGSTIQAYPSLCGVDDLQNAVDPIYHSESFEEIRTYVAEGLGSSCGVVTDTGNTAPVVDAGADYVVPKGTPLIVTGSASDAEQSELTYLWEQRDLGKVFRTHGVLTQSQITDTKKAPQGVLSFVWRWARDYPNPPYDGFGPMGFAALRLGSQSSQGRFGSNPPGFSTSPKSDP